MDRIEIIKLQHNMKIFRLFIIVLIIFSHISLDVSARDKHTLTIKGTRFEINGQPFEYTGVSFFNAMYNAEFNRDSELRRDYLRKFKSSGINVLRIWCQWDNGRRFIDGGPGKTLYNDDGSLKPELLERLKEIVRDADEEEMVILLVLFSRESWNENIRLSDDASDRLRFGCNS